MAVSLSLSLSATLFRLRFLSKSPAFDLSNLHFFSSHLVNPTPLFSFTKVWCCESVEGKLGSRPERKTLPCNRNASLDNITGQTFMNFKQVLCTVVTSILMSVDHCEGSWFNPRVAESLQAFMTMKSTLAAHLWQWISTFVVTLVAHHCC